MSVMTDVKGNNSEGGITASVYFRRINIVVCFYVGDWGCAKCG